MWDGVLVVRFLAGKRGTFLRTSCGAQAASYTTGSRGVLSSNSNLLLQDRDFMTSYTLIPPFFTANIGLTLKISCQLLRPGSIIQRPSILNFSLEEFDVQVTVHRDKFL